MKDQALWNTIEIFQEGRKCMLNDLGSFRSRGIASELEKVTSLTDKYLR